MVDPLDTGTDTALLARLRAELARRGVASAAELGAALGRSQPTVSRALAALVPAPVVIGRARRTRYGWPSPIHGAPARHTLHWVHEDGRIQAWGTLSFIAGERVHVLAAADGGGERGGERSGEWLLERRLPWFLATLRSEGFLGRLLARQLQTQGLADNPERWPLEHQLFAALYTPDSPGALTLGEPRQVELPEVGTAADYDTLADAVTQALPIGSSAGGEQAKFLARRRDDGAAVLVKFSPPRGTPFGERWHELLHLEALALEVLGEHGVPVAASRVVQTRRRTCLESRRFDRTAAPPREGRRHVVALAAVHEAFVGERRGHWGDSADALARQGRLAPEAAAQIRALVHFGRLIGNNDMHFGNLSLFVAPADVAAARLTLAPLYDMLPMRWRPDATSGELGALPFAPEPIDVQSAARGPALVFWERALAHPALGAEMRALAGTMERRLREAADA